MTHYSNLLRVLEIWDLSSMCIWQWKSTLGTSAVRLSRVSATSSNFGKVLSLVRKFDHISPYLRWLLKSYRTLKIQASFFGPPVPYVCVPVSNTMSLIIRYLHQDAGQGRGGLLTETLGRGCDPLPKTLALVVTKMCDFSYPTCIYNLIK